MIYRAYYFIYKSAWVPASVIIEPKETSDPTNNNQPTPPGNPTGPTAETPPGNPTGPTAETTAENPTLKPADNSPEKAQKIGQSRHKNNAVSLDKSKQEPERWSK